MFFLTGILIFHISRECITAVLRIRIRWIRKILASWIRIRKKYAYSQIRIQGLKFQSKAAKKTFLLLKTKKRDYKNFFISEWLIKF